MNKKDKDLTKHEGCKRSERPNGPYYGRRDSGKYRGLEIQTTDPKPAKPK